jgi:hypothetical protein
MRVKGRSLRTFSVHGIDEEEGGANELNNDATGAETFNGLPLVIQPSLRQVSADKSLELAKVDRIVAEWRPKGGGGAAEGAKKASTTTSTRSPSLGSTRTGQKRPRRQSCQLHGH